MERLSCLDKSFQILPRWYSILFMNNAWSVKHIDTWRYTELHQWLYFVLNEVLIQNTQTKLALRLYQFFLEWKFNLLALLAIFLPVENNHWILVGHNVLPELAHWTHSWSTEEILRQNAASLIFLLFFDKALFWCHLYLSLLGYSLFLGGQCITLLLIVVLDDTSLLQLCWNLCWFLWLKGRSKHTCTCEHRAWISWALQWNKNFVDGWLTLTAALCQKR